MRIYRINPSYKRSIEYKLNSKHTQWLTLNSFQALKNTFYSLKDKIFDPERVPRRQYKSYIFWKHLSKKKVLAGYKK